MTAELMRLCDLVVVTGSQANVRQAYSSGTPAIGVGAGNVPVIVDETADLPDAARKIAASKTVRQRHLLLVRERARRPGRLLRRGPGALATAGGYSATAAGSAI
jgi:sulfoacetaldehyde dehydrogenase